MATHLGQGELACWEGAKMWTSGGERPTVIDDLLEQLGLVEGNDGALLYLHCQRLLFPARLPVALVVGLPSLGGHAPPSDES